MIMQVSGLTDLPVKPSSTVIATAHPTKPVPQLKITVKRRDGETVLEGEAWCYTFR
jgi:hypothetical protein